MVFGAGPPAELDFSPLGSNSRRGFHLPPGAPAVRVHPYRGRCRLRSSAGPSEPGKVSVPRPLAHITVLKLYVIYALLGALWILFSDQLVEALGWGIPTFTRLQTLKGWIFVIVTASFLYLFVRRTDGTYVWWRARGVCQRDGAGLPYRMSGACVDITERKRSETAMRRQNTYLEALHETTLGLMGQTDLTGLFQAIVGRAVRFADADEGWIAVYDPRKNDFEFEAAVGKSDYHIGSRFEAGRGIAGEVWRTDRTVLLDDYQTRPGRADIAGYRLRHATVATPERGEVTIRTENRCLKEPIPGFDGMGKGDYVVLTVSDNGRGIVAKDLEKIFEPFYTKKIMGRSGTGLGLAVVWGTVKDHHGYIDVQSEEGKK
jgi:PAS domain-containing protein